MPVQSSLSAWLVHFMMSAGLSLNGEFVKSQLAHIHVDMHLQERVPLSAMPHARFGQSVPSGMHAMPVLMPLHAALAAPPVLAMPAVPLPVPPEAVPAVLDAVPASELDVPAVLDELPPSLLPVPAMGGTTVVPDVPVLVFPVPDEELPPEPGSGVSALEQPEPKASAKMPTDAMPAYTLIMETSLFETRRARSQKATIAVSEMRFSSGLVTEAKGSSGGLGCEYGALGRTPLPKK